MPVVNEFFWALSRFLGFNQNRGSKVVCCPNVNGFVTLESAVSNKYVGRKISGGNMP
jgi:hypothetical protein